MGAFARWVRVEHSDDVLAMYADESQEMQRFTKESNRLWEQHIAEYVAVVTHNPATYLDQPGVAAYVAHLESICAVAQSKVAEEIQAIQDPPNQPALIDAHERIMRETIPELRGVPLPKAVRWIYEGRAFPLMEEFSQYGKFNTRVPPHERRPETLLLTRIQLIPGLDKCSRATDLCRLTRECVDEGRARPPRLSNLTDLLALPTSAGRRRRVALDSGA